MSTFQGSGLPVTLWLHQKSHGRELYKRRKREAGSIADYSMSGERDSSVGSGFLTNRNTLYGGAIPPQAMSGPPEYSSFARGPYVPTGVLSTSRSDGMGFNVSKMYGGPDGVQLCARIGSD
jgi:hypothetical protein